MPRSDSDARREGSEKHVDEVHTASIKLADGAANYALSDYAWQCRFCPVTSAEWFTSPLNEDQSYHIAYFMDLTTSLLKKIGIRRLPKERLD